MSVHHSLKKAVAICFHYILIFLAEPTIQNPKIWSDENIKKRLYIHCCEGNGDGTHMAKLKKEFDLE